MAEALALVRALRRLAGQTAATRLAYAAAVLNALATLGAGVADPGRFTRLVGPGPVPAATTQARVQPPGRGWFAPSLSPPLAAAQAAQMWMELGPTEPPTPVLALSIAAALLIRTGATRITFSPAGRPIRRSASAAGGRCRPCAAPRGLGSTHHLATRLSASPKVPAWPRATPIGSRPSR